MLELTLKREWFEMIESGVKKEEYREVKQFHLSRLLDKEEQNKFITLAYQHFKDAKSKRISLPCKHTQVRFRNGYSANSPTIICDIEALELGIPVPEWSGNWQEIAFCIKLK